MQYVRAKLVDWLAKNSGSDKYLTPEYVTSVFSHNNTSIAALAGQDDTADQFLSLFRDVLKQANISEA